MPLNSKDEAWIREQIRESHEKQGIYKFVAFLKNWGGILIAGALVAFVLGQWRRFQDHFGCRLRRS
jgi:hypothetical protein